MGDSSVKLLYLLSDKEFINIACASSKDWEQPAQPHHTDQSSLFAWRRFGSLATQNVPCKDSDQTARMRSLIRVFAGHTCNLESIVGKCSALAQLSSEQHSLCEAPKFHILFMAMNTLSGKAALPKWFSSHLKRGLLYKENKCSHWEQMLSF